ncbi:hypothetical protein WICPIJ_001846 [Wickerhamomyces pijperi]|uniref:AMP-dependent synthetase/ligase domain-containing protein n=1 Tax=Wickerhamomyces pijperi TaxID=599730 RepID=A0A9P8QAV9_WICPI|nr:hypothetical protein WICPIJ_001846 [Wickerhamomyces pijperi]
MSVLPVSKKENAPIQEVFESLPLPFELTDTSVPVPSESRAGSDEFSPVFRNSFTQENGPVQMINKSLPTFYHSFQESVKNDPNSNCIGYRLPTQDGTFNDFYSWDSYYETAQKRDKFGSGVLSVLEKYAPDVALDNFIFTLFSANTPQWMLADLACHAYSIPNTPLYDTLGPQSTDYILKLTESPIVLLSQNKIDKILSVESPFMKILISIEDINDELTAKVEAKGYKLFDFKTILQIGSENIRPHIVPTAETLYTISFTSGTTGTPKGVELTHGNICAGVTFLFTHVHFPKNPVSLVFLPLAHVYERFKIVYELSRNGSIGFPHDPENVKTFLDDIKILKPTHLSSVPRLYNRIESGLKDKIKHRKGLQGAILRSAINYKINNENGLFAGVVNNYIIAKVRKEIGFENLDFLISGGSPLAGESIVYLRKVLNCGFYQGYGSSETFGGIAISTNHAEDPSRIGAIGVTSEFKLRNLPELNYTYESNKSGELLLRGPQIFHKYFKNEQATKDAVDSEGWFSTGDIVELNSKNQIKVIDRVKNFFKLSQGEYIASEKIENIYVSHNNFISQIFVHGDSFQNYVVGVLGIDEDLFFKFVLNKYTRFNSKEEVLENLDDVEFKKWLLKQLQTPDLFSFEKIKNLIIRIEPFSILDETLTPTLKLKRKNAQNKFQAEIDAMYAQGQLV